jgi:hypothetical protein
MKDMTPEVFQRTISFLEETPQVIGCLIAGLADEDLTWKPSEKEFSVVENICHLRDIEQEGYRMRIDKLLNEDKPFLTDIDGGKLAEERNYNSQNLNSALRAFTRARETNVRPIKHLTSDQLNRKGTFENVGPITLEGLLLMMQEHDQDHIKKLNNLRYQLSERSQSLS